MTDVPPGSAAENLVATVRKLWPEPANAVLERPAGRRRNNAGTREFAFLPSAVRPRLLVPVGVPAAAAAVRRYSEALGGAERYRRPAFSLLMRSGVAERLLTDCVHVAYQGASSDGRRSVEDVLGDALGEPVVVSIGHGSRRANQKPILHVLTQSRRARAFVKVGDTNITRTLVRGEANALRTVAGLPLTRVTPPRVLDLITWNGLDLLVLSPLPTSVQGFAPRGGDQVGDAIVELAMAGGVRKATLQASQYWARIRARVDAIAASTTALRLGSVVERVEHRHGDAAFLFGCWHGDFTPWNLQRRGYGIVLWDWEWFASDVPLGFDALHYRQTTGRSRLGDAKAATVHLSEHAEADLGRLGVPAEQAAATVSLYLLEICSRSLLLAQSQAGEPLRARASWLLDILSAEHPRPTSPVRHSHRYRRHPLVEDGL